MSLVWMGDRETIKRGCMSMARFLIVPVILLMMGFETFGVARLEKDLPHMMENASLGSGEKGETVFDAFPQTPLKSKAIAASAAAEATPGQALAWMAKDEDVLKREIWEKVLGAEVVHDFEVPWRVLTDPTIRFDATNKLIGVNFLAIEARKHLAKGPKFSLWERRRSRRFSCSRHTLRGFFEREWFVQ